MKKQIQTKDAKGKVIENCIYDICEEKLIIMFTDDTFIYLRAERSYGEDLEITEDEFEMFDFGNETLIKGGFITKEEFQILYNEHKAVLQKSRETNQRLYYEQLKRQYEGKP